jgi:hypothetical protein
MLAKGYPMAINPLRRMEKPWRCRGMAFLPPDFALFKDHACEWQIIAGYDIAASEK